MMKKDCELTMIENRTESISGDLSELVDDVLGDTSCDN